MLILYTGVFFTESNIFVQYPNLPADLQAAYQALEPPLPPPAPVHIAPALFPMPPPAAVAELPEA